MRSSRLAAGALIAVLVTGAGLVVGVQWLPGGGSGTWIGLLGGMFSLSFMWMLILRLRSLLANPRRRWLELFLLLVHFTVMLLIFAWVHHEIGLVDMAGATTQGSRDFGDALYFSIVTITTVGYGDFVPTGAGRTIAAMQGLLGYFILGILVSAGFQLIAPHTEPSMNPDPEDLDSTGGGDRA